MSKIEIGQGSSHIEASVIAQGLALEPSRVQAMMRKGEITSLCERGMNEDAGHRAHERHGLPIIFKFYNLTTLQLNGVSP